MADERNFFEGELVIITSKQTQDIPEKTVETIVGEVVVSSPNYLHVRDEKRQQDYRFEIDSSKLKILRHWESAYRGGKSWKEWRNVEGDYVLERLRPGELGAGFMQILSSEYQEIANEASKSDLTGRALILQSLRNVNAHLKKRTKKE